MKKRITKKLCLILAFVLVLASAMFQPASTVTVSASGFGGSAMGFLTTISSSFPGRAAGGATSRDCGDWILGLMQSWGYAPQIQNFVGANGNPCRNLIFVKPGASGREIIISAHYDSDPNTSGTDDNGSGVSVVLETAQRVASQSLPCTIRFIFFDDEEDGIIGSNYYMGAYGVGNAMCIINIDSVAAGDCRYVHGGGNGAGLEWLRQAALQISNENGLGMTTHPGLPGIPAGTRIQGSDQMFFAYQGLPYIYCEASLYSTGRENEKAYRVQTADGRIDKGQIMHTQYDNLGSIQSLFGSRTQGHLSAYSQLVYLLATRLQPNGSLASNTPAQPAPTPTTAAPTQAPATAAPTAAPTTAVQPAAPAVTNSADQPAEAVSEVAQTEQESGESSGEITDSSENPSEESGESLDETADTSEDASEKEESSEDITESSNEESTDPEEKKTGSSENEETTQASALQETSGHGGSGAATVIIAIVVICVAVAGTGAYLVIRKRGLGKNRQNKE